MQQVDTLKAFGTLLAEVRAEIEKELGDVSFDLKDAHNLLGTQAQEVVRLSLSFDQLNGQFSRLIETTKEAQESDSTKVDAKLSEAIVAASDELRAFQGGIAESLEAQTDGLQTWFSDLSLEFSQKSAQVSQDVEKLITEAVEVLAAVENGKDGRDGVDAPLVEPVKLVEGKTYEKNTTGSYGGGLWVAHKLAQGNPDEDPLAWTCVLDGFTDFLVKNVDRDQFEATLTFGTGKQITTNFTIPVMEHKGIFEQGTVYTPGQWVTKGSAMFKAVETTEEPPPGNGWQQVMVAPRGRRGPDGKDGTDGRDGIDGVDGKSIEGPRGKPGRNGKDGKDGDVDWDIVKAFVNELDTTDWRSDSYRIRSFRGSFHHEETYIPGDVVLWDTTLFLNIVGGQFENISEDPSAWEKLLGVPKQNMPSYMLWRGDYNPGDSYGKGDVVIDGDWTMVSVCDNNTDRPAPQPIGEEFNLYSPDNTTTESATGTQIINGMRYLVETSGWLTGYRIFTVIGNIYDVYVVLMVRSAYCSASLLIMVAGLSSQ